MTGETSGTLGIVHTESELLDGLRDPALNVRMHCIGNAGKFKTAAVQAALQAMLTQDSNPYVRSLCAAALAADHWSGTVEERLSPALTDPDSLVRSAMGHAVPANFDNLAFAVRVYSAGDEEVMVNVVHAVLAIALRPGLHKQNPNQETVAAYVDSQVASGPSSGWGPELADSLVSLAKRQGGAKEIKGAERMAAFILRVQQALAQRRLQTLQVEAPSSEGAQAPTPGHKRRPPVL